MISFPPLFCWCIPLLGYALGHRFLQSNRAVESEEAGLGVRIHAEVPAARNRKTEGGSDKEKNKQTRTDTETGAEVDIPLKLSMQCQHK